VPLLVVPLLVGASCAHGPAAPTAERASGPPLAGLVLPRAAGEGRALVVEGRMEGAPARVALEVAAPLSTATAGCFRTAPRGPGESVRVPLARGGHEVLPVVVLEGLRLGGRPVPRHLAGLREREGGCEVVLGADALAPYALQAAAAGGQVRLLASRPAEAWAAAPLPPGVERRVLPLTREPTTDRPLLTAQWRRGTEGLGALPFALATGEEGALLGAWAAADGGGAPDALELAPGFGLAHVRPQVDPRWAAASPAGLLGAEVWGRFTATVDVAGGALVLERPAPPEVAPPLEVSLEDAGTAGRRVRLVLWRALPRGGRVSVEGVGAGGEALGAACTVAFSFPPSGVGEGATRTLPPPGATPGGCAWDRVQGVRAGALEAGPLEGCAGVCTALPPSAGAGACRCREGTAPGAAGPSLPAPPEEPPPEAEPEDPQP
jgi:hypothetical protein